MTDNVIEVIHLQKSFGDNVVLRDINFSVRRGEVVCIIGASGSGKSTMLRCINLLEDATAGTILYHGEDITGAGMTSTEYRTKLGMVFQQFNLFNNLNVLQNCTIGPVKVLGRSKEQARETAMKYLETVGMSQYIDARPAQLSGGQKQRVAIARALAMEPEVLLLDEVTAALDPEMVREVLDVILGLAQEGKTMLIVTHEMQFARAVADRVLFFDGGEIVEQDIPERFFEHPKTERAQKFLHTFEFDAVRQHEA